MKSYEIPSAGIGPLQGLKVVLSGVSTAGPVAAGLLSDFGANVIHIESQKTPDTARGPGTYQQDHRNQRAIALDIPSEEGRQIFFRLIKDVDILIESSKGGQWSRWGITDEVMWEINPALVIVHVSGFGQSGDPGYVRKAAWDGIGNAFGCVLFQNGSAEMPFNIRPYACDGNTAIYASCCALAGLVRARKTGKGESYDIAQFETQIRLLAEDAYRYFQTGKAPERRGEKTYYPGIKAAGDGVFRCRDGYYYMGIKGNEEVMAKALGFFGFTYGSEGFAERSYVADGTEQASALDQAIKAFCADKTMAEIDAEILSLGIPCSPAFNHTQAEACDYYRERNLFVTWPSLNGGSCTSINCVPKFKNDPSAIWRGAPDWGGDTRDIMEELGYSDEEIQSYYDRQLIR